MYLTHEQVSFYNKEGYLIIDNFVNDSTLDMMKKRIQFILKNTPIDNIKNIFTTGKNELLTRNDYFINSSNQIKIFLEEKAIINYDILNTDINLIINKIAHALHRDDFFSIITNDQRIKLMCKDLNIDDPKIVQSMYIFKPPKIGGKVKMHQDSSYLYTEPLSCTGFWIPIDDVDQKNGCMWFLPKSHKTNLLTRFVKNDKNELYYDPPLNSNYEHVDHDLFIPIETKKGSLVIFHGNLLHKSDENLSDRSRHAYSFHIIDGSSKWSEQNWLQYPHNDAFDTI